MRNYQAHQFLIPLFPCYIDGFIVLKVYCLIVDTQPQEQRRYLNLVVFAGPMEGCPPQFIGNGQGCSLFVEYLDPTKESIESRIMNSRPTVL